MAIGNDYGSNGKLGDKNLTGKLHDVVDQASDKASDLAGRAKDGFEVRMRKLGDVIVARPVGSVLIAFGVGYLLAKLRR